MFISLVHLYHTFIVWAGDEQAQGWTGRSSEEGRYMGFRAEVLKIAICDMVSYECVFGLTVSGRRK